MKAMLQDSQEHSRTTIGSDYYGTLCLSGASAPRLWPPLRPTTPHAAARASPASAAVLPEDGPAGAHKSPRACCPFLTPSGPQQDPLLSFPHPHWSARCAGVRTTVKKPEPPLRPGGRPRYMPGSHDACGVHSRLERRGGADAEADLGWLSGLGTRVHQDAPEGAEGRSSRRIG